jgi:hypothetical protein
MKITQLIQKLQEARTSYGDIEVCFPDYGDHGGYVDVEAVVPEYPWKVGALGVEDKEAGVSFICLK